MSKYLLLFICWIGFMSCNAQNKQDSVYTFVEQMPSFPGGESEMNRYIYSNVDLSEMPEEAYLRQGRINIKFIVETDGSLSNIEVKSERGDAINNAFKKTIQSMPKWTPGKHKGKSVRVYQKLPIQIHLKKPD